MVAISRRRFLSTASAAGAALAWQACGGSDSDSGSEANNASPGSPVSGGTLRSGLFFDPDNLDPAQGGFAFPVFQRVYSYLHHVDGKTLDVIPDLATGFEQPDPVTYLWTLRPGVRFQNVDPVNGRELTSADVVYSLNRLKTALNSIDPGFMARIAQSVEAPDPLTVRLVNKNPYASTMQVLGGYWYAIVPEELAEGVGGLTKKAIGSGPYILDSYEQETGAKLIRNPDYFDAPLPRLDGIDISVITDQTNLLTQFRTKNLDVNTAPLDAPRFDALVDELDGVMSSKVPGILDPWIGMNATRPPFNDPRVREAVDIAIDRQAMIRQIAFSDGGLNGPIPWGNELWALPQDELSRTYVTDVARAKQLISDAGLEGEKITHVITTALPLGREVGQTFKEQMKEIGLEIEIEVVEQNAFIDRVFIQRSFQSCGFAWFPVLDPTVSLRFVDEDDIFARVFGFSDPEVKRLYANMQSVFEYEERKIAMDELQRAVLRLHGPVLYLFDAHQYNLWWPWVHEWRPEVTELNGYNTEIWLSERD